MRIAVVTGIFPAWSVTFIMDQITYALDHGCDVDVYASRPGQGAEHAEIGRYQLSERIHYFPRSRHDTPKWQRSARTWSCLARNPRALAQGLRRGLGRHQLEDLAAFAPHANYDVVHCHFAPNAQRILPALRAGVLRGKLLVTLHGYDVLKAKPGSYADLFGSDAYYTANTSFLRQRAIELGCPAERVSLFPMGVSSTQFRPQRTADHSAGVDGEQLTLLTVARLVEFKGIEFGLRAFALLAPRFPQLRYEIVGDGPLRASLQQLAQSLGIAGRVRFLGSASRDQVAEALGRADVFVLPGVFDSEGQCEAQGVVLVEAQASGVPVVASRIGGIPEAVGEESAVLVEARDPQALARALQPILSDPGLRQAMAEAGPRFVARQFDQERLNDRLLRIYGSVAIGQDPRDVEARL